MTKYQANEKILGFLKNNPRYSYNAPTIFKHFKGEINLNTIRCELRRLEESKKILRETHGFYRIRLDSETLYYLENPPTLLHGIMVSMNRIRKLQKTIDTIPAPSCNLDVDDVERLRANGFVLKTNKRLVHVFDFDDDVDRRVTITVHGNGRVDIYLNCSNHPVNYHEFRDILNHCNGVVSFLGLFGNQRVVSFGMAKDYHEVRMTGCSELSLRAYMNQWFRVYNKEALGVTRVEQHLFPRDLPVSALMSMFEGMFLPRVNGVSRVDTREDVV